MNERQIVEVKGMDGIVRQGELELSTEQPDQIKFTGLDLGTIQFRGEDLFDAFIKLRLELEKHRYQLLCVGCRPNVWSSGIWQEGRKAFVHAIGSVPSRTAMVDIFDHASAAEAGSVAQQDEFRAKWTQWFQEMFNKEDLDFLSEKEETESLHVRISTKNGTIISCELQIGGNPPNRIVFSEAGHESTNFFGIDLFDAFINMRLELEGQGLQLLCIGCRSDVWPSGMSRDMGGGRKAYITHMDRRSAHADLVDIFDYATLETVGTVAEQKAFHEKWAASRREEFERRIQSDDSIGST
ncbi:MAG: hypothetical protein ABSE62_09905 [Chthoniobacteraceae bacterium]|jgi:hypothetical protein